MDGLAGVGLTQAEKDLPTDPRHSEQDCDVLFVDFFYNNARNKVE